MSYTGRQRYQDPRQKIKSHKRIVVIAIVISLIGLSILAYKNRYVVTEWIQALVS